MAYRYRLGRRVTSKEASLAVLAGLVLASLVHGQPTSSSSPLVPAQAAAAPPGLQGNVALGQQLASPYGWGDGQQWDCLNALWTRESGWSNTAENPQSGAYGIAQSLGHGPTNQYPAGPANPPASSASAQISWGLAYIETRYQTPCAAWAHEETDGWY